MLVNEAVLLANILDRLSPTSILDIGSGDRAGREIVQPHIGAAFRGHNVTWTDKFASPGVLQCDICDTVSVSSLLPHEMVTACSVLEHVTDIDAAIASLRSIATRWLLVSVPFHYPEHHCPIDNMWRPSAEQLAKRLYGAGMAVVEMYETEPETFYGIEGVNASLVLAEHTRYSEK